MDAGHRFCSLKTSACVMNVVSLFFSCYYEYYREMEEESQSICPRMFGWLSPRLFKMWGLNRLSVGGTLSPRSPEFTDACLFLCIGYRPQQNPCHGRLTCCLVSHDTTYSGLSTVINDHRISKRFRYILSSLCFPCKLWGRKSGFLNKWT